MKKKSGYVLVLREFYRPGSVVYNSRCGRHELVLVFTHRIPCSTFTDGWSVTVKPCNSFGVPRGDYYTHCYIPSFLDFAGTLGRIRGA